MVKERVNITLDKEVWDFAKKYADENKTTVSAVINQHFFELMKRSEKNRKK